MTEHPEQPTQPKDENTDEATSTQHAPDAQSSSDPVTHADSSESADVSAESTAEPVASTDAPAGDAEASAPADTSDASSDPAVEAVEGDDDAPSRSKRSKADDADAEPAEPVRKKKKPLKPVVATEVEMIDNSSLPRGEMHWYVLKVQSNREDSVRDAIAKRLKLKGLDQYCEEVVVPTERTVEIKNGKKKVVERKFYPGYVMARLDMNDEVWATIREVGGVGDFISEKGKPQKMSQVDIDKMLRRAKEVEEAPRLKINFQKGDKVKIKTGPFENFDGDVDEVNETRGKVKVLIQVFGRPNPVELEYNELERIN